MTAKEILEQLLSHTGLTANSLAAELGLGRAQALYDIQNGKTKSITPSMADRIMQKFPDVSRVWLLTGEGDMLKNGALKQTAYGDNNQIAGGNINNGTAGDTTTTTTNNTTNNYKDCGRCESNLLEKAIDEIGEQRKMYSEHVGRLLSIIEKMSEQ